MPPAQKDRSAACFIYLFFSLCSLWLIPLATAYFSETNLPPLRADVRLVTNIIFLNLAAAYCLFLKNPSRSGEFGKAAWAALILVGVALCATPPVFSGDLNEYLLRGRIWAVHHANPYYHAPNEFPNDLMYPYTSWWNTPHTYGPIFAFVQTAPILVFPDSIIGPAILLKIILLAFLIGSCLLFGKILEEAGVPERQRFFTALALNPLFIVMTLLDGHNDIVMIFFTFGAVLYFLRGRYTRSFLFWTLAFLVKYTVVLILPFLIVRAIRLEHEKDPSGIWFFILKQLALNVLVIAAVFAPFWRGVQTFGVLIEVSQWFYSNTVPYMAHQALGLLGLQVGEKTVKYVFLGLFAAVYGSLLWLAATEREIRPAGLFRIFGVAYLAFFCAITSPVMANYYMWALPWLLLAELPLPNFFTTLMSFMALFFYFKRPNYLMALALLIYGMGLWANRKKLSGASTS